MLALLALVGCWRPAPYTPPSAPVEEPARADAEQHEPGGEGPVAEGSRAAEPGADDGEGADGEATGDAEAIAEPEAVDEVPPFPAYRAETVQAPVTIVDDYGRPIAILDKAGWELEVRGEESIRTRVSCSTCSPQVEGWLQPHLLQRKD